MGATEDHRKIIVMSALMTLPEMCEELGITAPTAYHWRQVGKGPKGVRVGKTLRYRRSDVEAWINGLFDQ